VGGAQVSEVHANFLVNTGSATAQDFLELMRLVQEKVLARFGVRLEPEVQIL
jgi:UDP-N-acetylmuramate dehydrogenase